MKAKLALVFLCLFTAACVTATNNPGGDSTPTSQPPNLPNPASVYCTEQGNKSEIRTAEDGSQSGVCVFLDGSECGEWAYFRGECAPSSASGTMPNPASVYCVEQGYKSEIRTAQDGSQAGFCIFTDGSECDEWAYFRGECAPGDSLQVVDKNWKTYTNTELGYSFEYPALAEVSFNDDPTKALFISGAGMGSETWGLSHPSDIEEYRIPDGTDLLQWLTDHYMLGEKRLPDEQIANTTAIHFRHESSPQSYADDRYYFAHNGQLYMLLIGHGSDTEDWELDNRFLNSFQFNAPASASSAPTPIPTALPVDPASYQDWMTYTQPDYGFTLRLPDVWAVEENPSSDPLLAGHEIVIHSLRDSQKQSIRLTFRKSGEDTPLWPTGVGQGEFIQNGSLEIAAEPAVRLLLVCPTGEVTAIWYHQAEDQPNLVRGDMEFGIIFTAGDHCAPGLTLDGKMQLTGETIISSLNVP